MAVTTYPGIIRSGKVVATTEMELPDGTEVYVVVPSSVTARVAKRIANRWLIGEVGNLLMADNGSLVATEQGWVWQFEVYITSVAHKAWGPIGTLNVSAVSSEVIDTEKTKSIYPNVVELIALPHSNQEEDGYCLTACTQMVLAYLGISRSQHELARQLGVISTVFTLSASLSAISLLR